MLSKDGDLDLPSVLLGSESTGRPLRQSPCHEQSTSNRTSLRNVAVVFEYLIVGWYEWWKKDVVLSK